MVVVQSKAHILFIFGYLMMLLVAQIVGYSIKW